MGVRMWRSGMSLSSVTMSVHCLTHTRRLVGLGLSNVFLTLSFSRWVCWLLYEMYTVKNRLFRIGSNGVILCFAKSLTLVDIRNGTVSVRLCHMQTSIWSLYMTRHHLLPWYLALLFGRLAFWLFASTLQIHKRLTINKTWFRINLTLI